MRRDSWFLYVFSISLMNLQLCCILHEISFETHWIMKWLCRQKLVCDLIPLPDLLWKFSSSAICIFKRSETYHMNNAGEPYSEIVFVLSSNWLHIVKLSSYYIYEGIFIWFLFYWPLERIGMNNDRKYNNCFGGKKLCKVFHIWQHAISNFYLLSFIYFVLWNTWYKYD